MSDQLKIYDPLGILEKGPDGDVVDKIPVPLANDKCRLTAEGIPVFSIYIWKVPYKTNTNVIQEYFKQFGHIISLNKVASPLERHFSQYILKYSNAESAAIVLKKKEHDLKSFKILVTAAPSWEQPFQLADYEPILCLDDFALEELFQYLDMLSQVRFKGLHSRLNNIFSKDVCSTANETIAISKMSLYSLWDAKELLMNRSTFVSDVMHGAPIAAEWFDSANEGIPKIYDIVKESFQSIDSVQLYGRRCLYTKYKPMFEAWKVSTLDLFNCHVTDSDVAYLRYLPSLKNLGLAQNRSIRGETIVNLCRLVRLSVFGCINIGYDAVIAIAKALRLQFLDMRFISNTYSNFVFLGLYCQELEVLKMDSISENSAHHIASLPNLKELHCQFFNDLMYSELYERLSRIRGKFIEVLKFQQRTSSFLPDVRFNICLSAFSVLRVLWMRQFVITASLNRAIASLTTLEELNLEESQWRSTHDGILPIIENCPKLRRLCLRKCSEISTPVIYQIVEIIEKRRHEYVKDPLIMLIGGTSAAESWLNGEGISVPCTIKLMLHINSYEEGLVVEKTLFDIEDIQDHYSYKRDSSQTTDLQCTV